MKYWKIFWDAFLTKFCSYETWDQALSTIIIIYIMKAFGILH